MPPIVKYSKESVLNCAVNITRENGIKALTARALAENLGCSVKPIFSYFKNMEEIHKLVLDKALDIYHSFLERELKSGKYPPYKAYGMGYICFAREESELFKLLFMRDRSKETITENYDEIKPIIDIIKAKLKLNENEAREYHLEMWIFVHGIATMVATNYLEWDATFIEKALTDVFMGLNHRFTTGKNTVEGDKYGSCKNS